MSQGVDAVAKPDGQDQVVVHLEPGGQTVTVPAGTLLGDAIVQAGSHIPLPCGGQGRCGRCVVEVREGSVRRRSMVRLTNEDIARGYALACQTIVNSDARVWVPTEEQRLERIEHGDTADKAAPDVVLCPHEASPWVSLYEVSLDPPSLGENTPDLERLQRHLARRHGLESVTASMTALQRLPHALREGEWTVTAVVEQGGSGAPSDHYRLLDVIPGRTANTILGLAIDIGTTSVVTYLGDLTTGKLVDRASAYNGQIAFGEDVISRIIYARDPDRRRELQDRVVSTINGLIDDMLLRQNLNADDISVALVAGNTTMTHLFLGVPADYIRLEPFVSAAGSFVPVPAHRLGLHIHPEAAVDCLPAVGAYVGGDITAGVLRSGLHREEPITLFIDIGTNGEMVLGNSEWLISCACSAGPAFEGAGATSGMRAVTGAIDDVWIDPRTLEPMWRTLGDVPPLGICGSGMISLLGELMFAGVIDKSGRIAVEGLTPRARRGEQGLEYVVAWAAETAEETGDVVLNETDIQNLLRAKAAIYAGAVVLCESVGMSIGDVERVMIGGSFGRHIDIEKAIQIGLLPDLPWDRFIYLGNTSIQGAYLALNCRGYRTEIDELAAKMTYLELSADNRFMDAFTSALFIPHTDERLFPSVHRAMSAARGEGASA
jgi:uncharacterized 2Fe-2S/4Fe-4S cluster protein (DUF4445 family)